MGGGGGVETDIGFIPGHVRCRRKRSQRIHGYFLRSGKIWNRISWKTGCRRKTDRLGGFSGP